MKILLVEDVDVLRQTVRRQLSFGGHAVFEACDGREALGFLEQEEVDLLITDLDMPGMDGLELISEIRFRPGTVTLPILVFTARKLDIVCKAAIAMGATKCLMKPMPTPLLLREIDVFAKSDAEISAQVH